MQQLHTANNHKKALTTLTRNRKTQPPPHYCHWLTKTSIASTATKMSHLAPFSYIDRFVTMLTVFLWALLYIHRSGNWRKINLLQKKNWNVRAAVCNLLLAEMVRYRRHNDAISNPLPLSLINRWLIFLFPDFCFFKVMFLFYDILNMDYKYFHPNNSALLTASGTLINCGFTFKSSAHFLTLAFWASVAKETFAAKSFGSSWEFTVSFIMSISATHHSIIHFNSMSIIVPSYYIFHHHSSHSDY